MKQKRKKIDYSKWGYIFILPFFLSFFIFSLIPLVDTIRYSFFEYYRSGLKQIGPNFVGMENYASLLKSDMLKYAWNTLILWLIGFVPQIVIALLLASWFVDARLKIRGQQFFKVVIYLPNLIMASAFAMLFFTLFSNKGPINSILLSMGLTDTPIDFMGTVFGTRTLIGVMNFLMWFGNTTIMLMAAIMGISPDIFEASEIDGCNSIQRFFLYYASNDSPDSCLYTDYFYHRRSPDVRRASDSDKWSGKPGPYFNDLDYVPQQPFKEQKLWYGGCAVCLPVHCERHSVLYRIPHHER